MQPAVIATLSLLRPDGGDPDLQRHIAGLLAGVFVFLNGAAAILGFEAWTRAVYGYYGRRWPELRLTEENLRSPMFWMHQRLLGVVLLTVSYYILLFLLDFDVLRHPIVFASLVFGMIIACFRSYPREGYVVVTPNAVTTGTSFLLEAEDVAADISAPRSCQLLSQLVGFDRADYWLARVDPPFPGRLFGPGQAAEPEVILATRLEGQSLTELNKGIVAVYIARILDPKIRQTGTIERDQIKLILWGIARAKLSG